MKRKHLILLPAFAAALAAWAGAARYLCSTDTVRAGIQGLDLILLAHLLLLRLDRLRERLAAWPAGEKGLCLGGRKRKDMVNEAPAPETTPSREDPDPRTDWLRQLEQDIPTADPAPAPQKEPRTQPRPMATSMPMGGYAELTAPERLQLGLPPRLCSVGRRTALQIIGAGDGLTIASHWLGQQCRGSDLINQHLPAFFRMAPLSPGGIYRLSSDGLQPARLTLLADGSLELREKGSLHIERC